MADDDAIDTLNELIETCRDGESGFRSCADNARRTDLRQLFAERAEGCYRAAAELQGEVMRLGGVRADSGSAASAVPRGWVAVKARLAGYTDLALLEECERGEDVALERYRSALSERLPAAALAVVKLQYAGVDANHAQIRTLRDEARKTAQA